jgi:CheY-like chemotaxis protein
MLLNFNPDDRDMYAEYLGYVGFVSLTLCEAFEAVQLARKVKPAAIVADMSQNDFALIQRLRLESRAIVIAVSSRVFPEERKLALRAGCHVFLGKPCFPSTLAAVLDRALAALK